MSTTRRIDDGTVADCSYQLRVLELEEGDTVFYDDENVDAWMQADEDHAITIDGRWR